MVALFLTEATSTIEPAKSGSKVCKTEALGHTGFLTQGHGDQSGLA
jgi:hypothetical protein